MILQTIVCSVELSHLFHLVVDFIVRLTLTNEPVSIQIFTDIKAQLTVALISDW